MDEDLILVSTKTLIVKDGDTLLESPELPKLLAEMRELYDRSATPKTNEEFLKEVHEVQVDPQLLELIMKTKTAEATVIETDDDYDLFREAVQRQLQAATEDGPLFVTDADLWQRYLDSLPEGRRQHYRCRTCQTFFRKYAGLAIVRDDGSIVSPLWEGIDAPGLFADFVQLAAKLVRRAKIVEPFVAFERVLGTPQTGDWSHYFGQNSAPWEGQTLTAFQRAAELSERVGILGRAIGENDATTASEALRVLQAEGALPGAEKATSAARWFVEVHAVLGACGKNQEARRNLLWRYAASAPPGFCNASSTLLGQLMKDIKDGLAFEDVRRRWVKAVDPELYRRQTKAMTEGAIERAEKVVEAMGIAPALVRRYARLEDVQAWYWRPPIPAEGKDAPKAGRVFDGVRKAAGVAKAEPNRLELPAVPMTCLRFLEEVLVQGTVKADRAVTTLEVLVPSFGAFGSLVAPVDPEAPAILQWDDKADRNPFSWYLYTRGSTCRQWGLNAGSWVEATGACPYPPHWKDPSGQRFPNHAEGIWFLLKDCRDVQDACGIFFPSMLRSELHEVRGVLEAHARQTPLVGREEATACGIGVSARADEQGWPVVVRVTFGNGGRASFALDRWK